MAKKLKLTGWEILPEAGNSLNILPIDNTRVDKIYVDKSKIKKGYQNPIPKDKQEWYNKSSARIEESISPLDFIPIGALNSTSQLANNAWNMYRTYNKVADVVNATELYNDVDKLPSSKQQLITTVKKENGGKIPTAGNGRLNTPSDSLTAYTKSREQLKGYIEKPTYNNLYEDSFLRKPIGWQENYYYKIKPNVGDKFEIDNGTYYNPDIQPDSMAVVKQSERFDGSLGEHAVKNIPLYPKPVSRRYGGIPIARGTAIVDPRQDSYYRPSNSNPQITPVLSGTAAKPITLPEVEIVAKKGEGYRNPMRHPTDIGSSADLASTLFMAPITQAMHLPSRAVNQYLGWAENKDVPFDSEISQTLGWNNNDPTDLWASARNMVADNAADFVLPPMAGALGHIGMVEAGKAADVASGYIGSAKNLADVTKKYITYKPNPVEFIKPAEKEMLDVVRGVGTHFTEEGLKNHKSLQSALTKAQSLTEEQFKDLTGFTRESVAGRIKKLQEVEQQDKLRAEWLKEQGISESYRPRVTNYEGQGGDRDIDIQGTGWSHVESLLTGNQRSANFAEELQNRARNRYNYHRNQNQNFILDKNLLTKPNILDRMAQKVTDAHNKNVFYGDMPENAIPKTAMTLGVQQELLPSLFARNATESIPRKLLQAVRAVEQAPKGESFIGAHSLSTDSYPASLRMLKQLLDKNAVDVNFHGFKNMNRSGFSQQVGLPMQTNLKEINTLIKDINEHPNLKGKIPFAKWHKQDVYPPTLTITRKKSGGKINSWELID